MANTLQYGTDTDILNSEASQWLVQFDCIAKLTKKLAQPSWAQHTKIVQP